MINIRLLLLMFIMLGLSACGRETLPEGIRLNWMSGGYHDLVVKRNGIDVQVVPADVQWVKARDRLSMA